MLDNFGSVAEALEGLKAVQIVPVTHGRFVRASSYLKTLPPPRSVMDAITGAQAIGRNVAVPRGAVDTSSSDVEDAWPTLWFTLGDSTNKTYIFHSTSAPNVYWIDLSEVDFSPGAKVRTFDAYDTSLFGDITRPIAALKLSPCRRSPSREAVLALQAFGFSIAYPGLP